MPERGEFYILPLTRRSSAKSHVRSLLSMPAPWTIGLMVAGTPEHPLLRVLVFSGAALVAPSCGQTSDTGSRAGAGGAAGAGGLAGSADRGPCPVDCAVSLEYRCDDYAAPETCRCDPAVAVDGSGCDSPWHFQCATAVPPWCYSNVSLFSYHSCRCDSTATTPEQCLSTSQFTCDEYDPPQGCRCDPAAPRSPVDCVEPLIYSCERLAPDIGCRCIYVIAIR
jgi:hypothetical protein